MSFVKKALGVAVATTFAATGLTLATAGTANACSTNDVCVYSDSAFGGYSMETYYSDASWATSRYAENQGIAPYSGDGVHNNVSSADNWDFSHDVVFYYNSDYKGPCAGVVVGGAIKHFENISLSNGKSMNDDMNSDHFNSTCAYMYNN